MKEGEIVVQPTTSYYFEHIHCLIPVSNISGKAIVAVKSITVYGIEHKRIYLQMAQSRYTKGHKNKSKQESHKMRLNIPLHLIAIYLLFKNFHKIII